MKGNWALPQSSKGVEASTEPSLPLTRPHLRAVGYQMVLFEGFEQTRSSSLSCSAALVLPTLRRTSPLLKGTLNAWD